MWDNNYTNKADKPDLLVEKLKSIYAFSEAEKKFIRRQIVTIFLTQFTKKWNNVSRKKDTFKSKYADFLQKDLIVNFKELESTNSNPLQKQKLNKSENILNTEVRVDRPCLSFEEGSDKTKMRRAQELASKHSYEELRMALAIKQKEFAAEDDSEEESEESNLNEHERNQILSMFMDARFSKKTYRKTRAHNFKMFGNKLYPPYYQINRAKQYCYPDNIEITDSGANVDLISLLDHTVRRILTIIDKTELQNLQEKKLTFLGKWGMDGASGQQTTRQSWASETNASFNLSAEIDDDIKDDPSDQAVFITSLVPLQLKAGDKILWTNVKPNSVLYCRPINFQFIKETDKVIKQNYRYYSAILDKVEIYCLKFKEMCFDIKFDMKCTMLDGKACNAITNQKSSASCNICDAIPNNMNNIAMVLSLPCKGQFYKLGFPILHSWIRFMEYVLHIAYNLDFKKGTARGNNKKLKKARKSKIQKSLKSELHLSVDIVKQSAGTTNTGNVGRAFFEQAERVSELIGVDKDILVRMHAILQVISCGEKIDLVKFKEHCIDTAKKCATFYSWYKMPPSIHKVLIHGCDIMKALNAPMIWFSEEPQEANNKVFRKARSEHSRMC